MIAGHRIGDALEGYRMIVHQFFSLVSHIFDIFDGKAFQSLHARLSRKHADGLIIIMQICFFPLEDVFADAKNELQAT